MGDDCDCKVPVTLSILDARLKALERIIDERDRRYTERFQAQEKAERIFGITLDAWKAHTNEWRGAMEDRERRFLSKGMGAVLGAVSIVIILIQLLNLRSAL